MRNDRNISTVILVADIIVLVFVLLATFYTMSYISPASTQVIPSKATLLGTYIICYIASFAFYPSIAYQRMVKSELIAKRVMAICLMTLMFFTLVTTLTKPFLHFPRTYLIVSILVFSVCLFAERIWIKRALEKARANNKNNKKIVLVGNEPSIARLCKIFTIPSNGYTVVGTFYEGEAPSKEAEELRIGNVNDLYSWLATHNEINELYGYFSNDQKDLVSIISKYCDNHLIRFYYVPSVEILNGSMTFSYVDDIPVVARREEPLSLPTNKFAKRLFDIIFSSFVLVFIFPWVYIFVSIMIRFTSPGPVLFKQERTGLDGKVFRCIKFRSMKVNDQADTLQATKDDPRKFPFGDFMRKTNIDELPQFINVFKGEMSIVGPRPHMLKHTEEYSCLINHFMVRHLAKPGITGLAQVSGFRGETKYIDQMEGRVKKDIEYIENWTFLLDIKIIIKTITNVIFRQEKGNAY